MRSLAFDAHRIFPRHEELAADLKRTAKVVTLSQILPPETPLRPLRRDHVEALKQSIRSLGLLQPLLVTPKGEAQYLILDGQHRYTALMELLEEKGQHPSQLPVNVIVLWAENPNADYGMVLAAYQANRRHWSAEAPGREEVEALVRAAFGENAVQGLWPSLQTLASLPEEHLERVLQAILETSPVESLPPLGIGDMGLEGAIRNFPPGVRAALYLLEGVAEGGLAGFIRALASSQERPSRPPAPRRAPGVPPLLSFTPPTRGADFKRLVRFAAKSLAQGLRGIRLRKQDLTREEVLFLLHHLEAALDLLNRLKASSPRKEKSAPTPPSPHEEIPLHPELVERVQERLAEEGLEIPDA